MKDTPAPWPEHSGADKAAGFSLTEFLVASSILLVVSFTVFSALEQTRRTAVIQAEMQSVLDNTRTAIEFIGRRFRQAGNDPRHAGFEAISIIGPEEVRIRSDITGSEAPAAPDRGDPDGDTNDTRETVTIRYNKERRRIEMSRGKSPAQVIADNISELSLEYFDGNGNPTGNGGDICRVVIAVSGVSPRTDPRTGKRYGIRLVRAVQVLP